MNIYSFIWNNINDINSIIVISIVIVFLTLLIANYYDLKYGIIPNKLSFFLFSYGIISNLLIFNVLNDNFFMYCYLAYMSIIFMISFALWKIAFWGGGDLKLFCAIGSSLSFIDILNQFNSFSVLNDFAFNCQALIYPKIFSILINSIILTFPFISSKVCMGCKENICFWYIILIITILYAILRHIPALYFLAPILV